jgi:predicted acylesterase/phospholipase RssA
MFDDVFVEGHGGCTAMALGAMHALDRQGLLAHPRRTTCYSMAAVMAVAMALGRSPEWLLAVASGSGLLRLGHATLVLCAAFRRVRVWLSKRLCRLLSLCGVRRGMTMRELRERTGHDVRVVVSSLSRGASYVVHADNAPEAEVRHVLLASCCVPGVFEFDGDLVDGGTFGGFGDAGLSARAGSLVLATDARSTGPTVVTAYRTLLRKMQRAWTRCATEAGATVLVMRVRTPQKTAMYVERLWEHYRHGALCTMRRISSHVLALSRSLETDGGARTAERNNDASGEHSRSSLDLRPSRDASSSLASMAARRRMGV